MGHVHTPSPKLADDEPGEKEEIEDSIGEVGTIYRRRCSKATFNHQRYALFSVSSS
jgi:hypothetical protein